MKAATSGAPEGGVHLGPAYLALTAIFVILLLFSAIAKLRRDPRVVTSLRDAAGVPLRYFPPLAACELAGAAGLLLGIWWPPPGIAAGAALVLYFIGAIVAHLRAGDAKGIGPAAVMLFFAVAVLTLAVLVR